MSAALGAFVNVTVVEDHKLFSHTLITKFRKILFTSYKIPAQGDLVTLASA